MLQLYRHAIHALSVCAVLLLSAGPAAATPATCDLLSCVSLEWLPSDGGNGHHYVYVPDAGLLWTAANDAAIASSLQSATGHLASLTTFDENAFVTDQLLPAVGNLDPANERHAVWLGALQLDTPADPAEGWIWWTLEDFDAYTNWAPGEPNDQGSDERFLSIWTDGVRRGSWNDENIGWVYNLGYVVEYDLGELRSVPEPGPLGLLLPVLLGLPLVRRP